MIQSNVRGRVFRRRQDARGAFGCLRRSGRFTCGLRHWLAIENEFGGFRMGAARFDDVPVTINGGSPMTANVERTTRAGRLTTGATLRLSVAWLPTVSAGLGGQLRLDTDGVIAGTDIVPDGHKCGTSGDTLVYARVGLDRRIKRRFVVGVSAGLSRSFASPSMDAADISISLGWYWYPPWAP